MPCCLDVDFAPQITGTCNRVKHSSAPRCTNLQLRVTTASEVCSPMSTQRWNGFAPARERTLANRFTELAPNMDKCRLPKSFRRSATGLWSRPVLRHQSSSFQILPRNPHPRASSATRLHAPARTHPLSRAPSAMLGARVRTAARRNIEVAKKGSSRQPRVQGPMLALSGTRPSASAILGEHVIRSPVLLSPA